MPKPFKPAIVVSNTSPLYYATQIGQLDLVRQLYGTILIPDQVYSELMAGSAGLKTHNQIRSATWILRKAVKSQSLVTTLQKEIDSGKAEAIVLAKEMNADLILLDEHFGRKIAAREGLQRTELVGVLLDAKRTHLITELEPILSKLFKETNFRGTTELYQLALKLAGE